jgi:hypothetical protein
VCFRTGPSTSVSLLDSVNVSIVGFRGRCDVDADFSSLTCDGSLNDEIDPLVDTRSSRLPFVGALSNLLPFVGTLSRCPFSLVGTLSS